MRQCPSVEGSASPLITHRIGVDVCLARQGAFFHKCHRCIYRGQAATWEPAAAAVVVELPEVEPVVAAVKLKKPRTTRDEAAPTRAPAKGRSKAAAAKAAESGA